MAHSFVVGAELGVPGAGDVVWYGMVWYVLGMVEVCEGVPVAVGGWVFTDRHDLEPCTCAANSLHRGTMSLFFGGGGGCFYQTLQCLSLEFVATLRSA